MGRRVRAIAGSQPARDRAPGGAGRRAGRLAAARAAARSGDRQQSLWLRAAQESRQRRPRHRRAAEANRVRSHDRRRPAAQGDARRDRRLFPGTFPHQGRRPLLLCRPRRAARLAQLPAAYRRGHRAPRGHPGEVRRRQHGDRRHRQGGQPDERHHPRRLPRESLRARHEARAEGPVAARRAATATAGTASTPSTCCAR